ncbi:hypothetical protein AYX13_07133, partial [Cryptococcus neoformans]
LSNNYGNGGYYGNELTKWLKSTTAIPKTVGISPLLTQCTGKDVLAVVPVEMAEKSVSSGSVVSFDNSWCEDEWEKAV